MTTTQGALFPATEPTPAPRPSQPAWVTAYITRTGNPDPRRLGRNARPRTCPGCGRLTLVGADHHRIAAHPTVDPHPLTPALEAGAVLLAIATYELRGEPPTWELHARTFPGVPTWPLKPADSCRVVAAHSCTRPPLTTATLTIRARTAQFATGPAPF